MLLSSKYFVCLCLVQHRYCFLVGVNKVEVALLSELEFKHQVTTARGEGGREGGGGGGHESTEVPGCPEDRKRDGGRGGRGVVASRGWEGR